jgi:hypothetical protein
MKTDTLGLIGFVFVLLIITVAVFGVVGWGMNIYKLCQCDFERSYRAEVIRCVGIVVAPAGAVMGYVDIEDKPTGE